LPAASRFRREAAGGFLLAAAAAASLRVLVLAAVGGDIGKRSRARLPPLGGASRFA